MNTIEIELRGALTEKQYTTTLSFLKENATFIVEKNRIFIDYTTMLTGETFENRTLDIRARITNNQPELMIKQGSWGKDEARREISVQIKEGEFSNLVKAMAALGYTKGILCERHTLAFSYQGFEVALVTVPNHSYYFELEIMANSESEKKIAHEKLNKLCKELSLTPFTQEGFFTYMKTLNEQVNTVFDIDKDGEDFFRRKFKI